MKSFSTRLIIDDREQQVLVKYSEGSHGTLKIESVICGVDDVLGRLEPKPYRILNAEMVAIENSRRDFFAKEKGRTRV